MITYFKGDISDVKAEAIVNAANAIGYMGGWLGKKIKHQGVAESIHYHTTGVVEKEAKKVVWKTRPKVGQIYITSAANLEADYIFHAVTMFFPGTLSSIATVEKCILSLLETIKQYDVKSIAIPALGTGTGQVDKEEVAKLYKKYFSNQEELTVIIVDPSGNFINLVKKA
jgi:O-acetyl-ADP-ribose deacetylase (regulator of RNase III)